MDICDDLDTLPVLEGIVEWDDLTIHFRDREFIPEFRMDRIGEIHRSGTFWQSNDISFGSKDEDLIREDIHTHLTHELFALDSILDDSFDGLDPITILGLGRCSRLRIFEMGCYSDLCLNMHLWRSYLDLCRL